MLFYELVGNNNNIRIDIKKKYDITKFEIDLFVDKLNVREELIKYQCAKHDPSADLVFCLENFNNLTPTKASKFTTRLVLIIHVPNSQ